MMGGHLEVTAKGVGWAVVVLCVGLGAAGTGEGSAVVGIKVGWAVVEVLRNYRSAG